MLLFYLIEQQQKDGKVLFRKRKGKKMGVWKDLKIGLIRFVFCLLFKTHDQSDISPICVSSRGEEKEIGERCLLISPGSVSCTLGTVIKTRK